MSLSMVPGMPMTEIPLLARLSSPLNVPSPPMPTSASRPNSLQVARAFLRPASSRNSRLRADYSMVPPRREISLTLSKFNLVKSPLRRP